MQHKKIFIIDDEPDIRDALQQALELEGLSVLLASNGREALEALAAGECPALVLLDLTMPVMDGWSFLAERAKDAGYRSIPVVVLSATRESAANAVEAGADGFLKKPISLDVLLETVHRYLR